jgi:hypothetical protein
MSGWGNLNTLQDKKMKFPSIHGIDVTMFFRVN